MDRRAVSKALKDASEAIKAKDFQKADALTSNILMFDGSNANANVFRGLCREESGQYEEALNCYKMAVASKPDAVLGWQALSSFYEKREDPQYNEDLSSVYEKLLHLLEGNESMSKKRQDILLNRIRLLQQQRSMEEIERLVEKELPNISFPALLFKIRLILEDAYSALSRTDKLKELHELLIFQCNGSFEESGDLKEMIDKYIQSLRKADCDTETLTTKCQDILLILPDHKLSLELVILYKIELMLMGSCRKPDVSQITDRVARLSKEHPFSSILDSLEAWRNGQLDTALDILNEKSSVLSRWKIVFVVMARLGALLHRLDVCRAAKQKFSEVSQYGQSITDPEDILLEIQFSYWTCCSKSGEKSLIELSLQDMKAKVPSIRDQRVQYQLLFIRLSVLAGHVSDGEQIMKTLPKIEPDESNTFYLEYDICRCVLEYTKENYRLSVECLSLEGHSDFSDSLIWKGKSKWKLGEFQEAGDCFSKAFAIDPKAWEACLFLGYYYEKMKMSRKSTKAYFDAFALKKNELTGEALCDLLFKKKKYTDALTILEDVTNESSSTNLKWAWFRKGNVFMALGKVRDAVFAFEKASSFDENDAVIFECLGDANSSGRSFETAVKNYKKGISIDPTREYCQIRVASLLRILGDYHGAVEEYMKVLSLDSTNNKINGYKGIGDTYLSLAESSLQQQLVKLAIEQTEKAIYYLTHGVCLQPGFVSVVRSLADACLLLHDVSDSCLKVKVPVTLLKGSFADGFSEKVEIVDKEEILQLSTRLYATSLKLKEDSSTWCCLGYSLLHLYLLKNDRSLLMEAEVSVKRAVEINNADSSFWNLLGVIYSVDKPSFFQAQHCFIQAVKIDSENALAWSNLGYLYLMEGKVELAHEVFSRAQCEDPTLAYPWLGQGQIALLVDKDKEAFDLFRHSTVLSHTVFGAVVYSRLLLNFAHKPEVRSSRWYRDTITNLSPNALALSNDALTHSLALNPINKESLYNIALLQDKMGNSRLAVEYIKRCLSLDDGSDFNLHRNALRLIEFGRKEKLLQLRPSEPDSVMQLCIHGYILASRGEIDAAVEQFERAISLTDNPLERSQISTALGFHLFEADNQEAAIESLFESVQEDEVAPESILGLAAISVLNEDEELGASLVDELSDMSDNPHALYLHSLLLKQSDDYQTGLRHLQIAVFRRPQDPKLWHYLTRYISDRTEDLNTGNICSTCSQIALSLNPTSYAHARLLFDVYARFGDFLDRRVERLVCSLYRLYPTDHFACKSIATVAKRRIDHAERGSVKILQEFSRTMRSRMR